MKWISTITFYISYIQAKHLAVINKNYKPFLHFILNSCELRWMAGMGKGTVAWLQCWLSESYKYTIKLGLGFLRIFCILPLFDSASKEVESKHGRKEGVKPGTLWLHGMRFNHSATKALLLWVLIYCRWQTSAGMRHASLSGLGLDRGSHKCFWYPSTTIWKNSGSC